LPPQKAIHELFAEVGATPQAVAQILPVDPMSRGGLERNRGGFARPSVAQAGLAEEVPFTHDADHGLLSLIGNHVQKNSPLHN
jgi:hypothetical protein